MRTFLAMLVALPVLAAEPPSLSKYFVVPANEAAGHEIAARFEVEGFRDRGFYVYVPSEQGAELRALTREAELVDPDITATLRSRLRRDRGWHDFKSVQTALDKFASDYPSLAKVDSLGKTDEGRAIPYIRISSSAPGNKPKLMITGATHGNELITVEVVLGFVKALLEGYGNDGRLTRMVDEHELYFVPVASPDGYVRQSRHTNGVDPNRNFPYPDAPNKQSVGSVRALMAFAASKGFAGSIDFHSAAGMVFFPWAYTYDPIPADDFRELDGLTKKMAATNGYRHGQIAQTIYVAPGSSADYYYWKHKTRALGVEISEDGSSSLIPSMLKENLEMTWQFIEAF